MFDHSVVLRQLTVQEVEYESIARIICLGIAVLAAGLYLVTAGGVRANAAGKKDLTVTGCLQKGDDANEYNLTTKGVSLLLYSTVARLIFRSNFRYL